MPTQPGIQKPARAVSPDPTSPAISLTALSNKANALFRARRYREAAELNREGYRRAAAEGANIAKVRFLLNLGGCSFALLNYREALGTYISAREMAEAAGDWVAAGSASLNLSSLHLHIGEIESAGEEARRGLALLARAPRHPLRAQAAFQVAKLKLRAEGMNAARPLLADAIAQADASGNTALAAQIWNYQGYELMEAGLLDAAEAAMANAFRLRKTAAPSDLESSYRTLSLLKLAQGDAASAETFAGQAVAAAAQRPNWMVYYCRGRARVALNRTEEGLDDLRAALRLAERFRADLVPTDAHRISADTSLHDLYSAFVEAAAGLYLRTGRASLAAESFRAVESARAASLRALVTRAGRYQRLAPEYGELLAQLRAAESRLLGREDAAARAEARRLRYEMRLIEARAGLREIVTPEQPGPELDAALRRALAPDEALLSFHVGDEASCVWTLTRAGLKLHALPRRDVLSGVLASFATSVRNGGDDSQPARTAFDTLFGSLSAAVLAKRYWVFALEEDLFEAPLAALVLPSGALLGEQHSLRRVPSAHFLLREPAKRISGPFVAVGDPVCNRADPRARGRIRGRPNLELPRIPGSASEIRTAARAWGAAHPVLLEGLTATGKAVHAAIARRPAVLHFATHFIIPERAPARAGIVLSLRPDGSADILTAADIAAWPRAPRLVVLSGCSSGRGEARRGAGLLGLARSWIAAGSSSVVASLWPTPDSGGELFQPFYERLRDGDPAAEALRHARVCALRSGRARKRDWAAYVVFGNS